MEVWIQNPMILSICTIVSTLCWGVCFVWMHRIKSNQETFLRELHNQGKRIEELARAEHDMVREVHPQVGEIKERVEEIAKRDG
jgi:hypothetical protein